MRRQHGVQTHPLRQEFIGMHRVRVLVVADQSALIARMRRLSVTAAPDRADAPAELPLVAAPHPLSACTREVRGLLVRGLRNEAIADRLFIADRTVTCHAQAIYHRLDVANRTEAFSVALCPPTSDDV